MQHQLGVWFSQVFFYSPGHKKSHLKLSLYMTNVSAFLLLLPLLLHTIQARRRNDISRSHVCGGGNERISAAAANEILQI
jgi:hypothetical protein